MRRSSALDIREKALGPDHPGTAEALHNLAAVYFQQAHFRDAEPLYRRALDICEKALGPDHPTTVIVRKNLDTLLKGQRQK